MGTGVPLAFQTKILLETYKSIQNHRAILFHSFFFGGILSTGYTFSSTGFGGD
jgi:hypothetical protein